MNIDQAELQSKRERILKTVISAFILVHVIVTIAWLSPDNIALRQAIVDGTSGVWKFFGMWQGWELFAPQIRNVNSHAIALVRFDDGTTTFWPLPRFEQMGLGEKYQRDKFRKWNGDNVQWERYKEFWPSLARYVGRLHYDGKGPKPASFTLLVFTSTVPPMDTGVKRDNLPKHDTPRFSYFYNYKPEDFSI